MDWRRFCVEYGIKFAETGKNVKKGNINIRCPFCADDPSHHMGLSLEGKGWACWRGDNHRGRAPQRLIRELLQCDQAQATRIAQKFGAKVQVVPRRKKDNHDNLPISIPIEFQPFDPEKKSHARFHFYLRDRGFDSAFVLPLGLYVCGKGRFRSRIVFPIIDTTGIRRGWTGRSIVKGGSARYLSYMPHGKYGHGFDKAPGGRELYVVEGIFDELRIRQASVQGIDAVSLLSTSMSEFQMKELLVVMKRYQRTTFMFDHKARASAQRIARELAALHPRVLSCPAPEGLDLGDWNTTEVRTWLKMESA